MSGTATPIEILWTCVNLTGLIICAWALVDAIADLHYLQALKLNGAREIVARASARNETISVAIQALFFLIGITAMVTPPANPDRPVTPLGVIVGGGLCLAAVALVTKALLDRRDRRRVIDILSKNGGHA